MNPSIDLCHTPLRNVTEQNSSHKLSCPIKSYSTCRGAFACAVFSLLLFSFRSQPWFTDLYECILSSSYHHDTYRYPPNLSPSPSSTQNLALFDLSISPFSSWEVGSIVESAYTSSQAIRLRSYGIQVRYLWLNDIIGDPISLTSGISTWKVPHKALHDFLSPYHASRNVELHGSFGREWAQGSRPHLRAYGFCALGIANRGAPWNRIHLLIERFFFHCCTISLSASGYIGFGSTSFVDLKAFSGYGSIRHRSIDIEIRAAYTTPLWGTIAVGYARGVYAHSFPLLTSRFSLEYRLPFSIF